MSDKKIISYVKKLQSQGISDKQIKINLKNQGYKKTQIWQFMSEARSNNFFSTEKNKKPINEKVIENKKYDFQDKIQDKIEKNNFNSEEEIINDYKEAENDINQKNNFSTLQINNVKDLLDKKGTWIAIYLFAFFAPMFALIIAIFAKKSVTNQKHKDKLRNLIIFCVALMLITFLFPIILPVIISFF